LLVILFYFIIYPYKYLCLGIAHRLHLVICNGLGFWIRTKQESSSSVVPTTSNNTDEIDSDEEDLSDDIQIIPQSSTVNNFSNSIASSYQPLVTTNQNLNINYDDTITNETSIDEELDELSMDITDNWSIDLIEYVDPSTCDAIQQHVGEVMKKCRSFVKLLNKSSILMNHVSNLKKHFKINRSLQLDCKSRWNSSHHLVEGMLMYKKTYLQN